MGINGILLSDAIWFTNTINGVQYALDSYIRTL
jgi:hypothetical protein